MGFVFQPVKRQGLAASAGATPFSVLFLAFSSFLILAAVMLVALLFRLAIERRAAEIGILLAVGFSRRAVGRLLAAEGLLVAAAGRRWAWPPASAMPRCCWPACRPGGWPPLSRRFCTCT